jgi:RimJ/RimL family protein N-acetyltransferase
MSHATPKTERLRLRPYTLADEAGLFDVFADPDARTFYPEMSDPAKVRA